MLWPEKSFWYASKQTHPFFYVCVCSLRTLIQYVCLCIYFYLTSCWDLGFLFPSCRWSRRVVLWSSQQTASTANLPSRNEQVRTLTTWGLIIIYVIKNVSVQSYLSILFGCLWPNVLPSAKSTWSIYWMSHRRGSCKKKNAELWLFS